jgi:hypothetical protein
MKSKIIFDDPYFNASKIDRFDDHEIQFPVVESETIGDAIEKIKRRSKEAFAVRSFDEIQNRLFEVDTYFSKTMNPEIQKLINLIHLSSGFSKHDIEQYGLGLFSLLTSYDREKIGIFINKALKSSKLIETANGYLKRFGIMKPFQKWKEPELLSHFISGNVVGYTAILSRIGFPIKCQGAAQILKLPSSSALFPMIYLDKLKEVDTELRETIACGYWKGGDDEIESTLIKESDAINVLSSDPVVMDLKRRIKQYHTEIIPLFHGHKIGIAYIAQEFLRNPEKLDKVLNGLVRDISAFDGGACYNVKNIYVQGDEDKFSKTLFNRLNHFANSDSPVSKQAKTTGRILYDIYRGAENVLTSKECNAFVKVKQKPEFWKPDELYRYVQVMPVVEENEVCQIIRKNSHYLQTAVVAIPDDRIIPILNLFGRAGISNVHYPGSAPLIHVYEEPHDGEFDFIKVRYPYTVRFAATNFKNNRIWLK